ncbi:sulfur carrier protein ThiS [Aliifodinibius sp. S!AR15-10]|uniref:sulfur carrier protein ThiS n=1 Tax=Aliifodinibius sp. S!AR15-10 TaxID=2950437 RepID=UPI00285705DC|nr:sulfur carrier protein ThiS [Aliifodinibius sp. S!AR15-10]MDR8393679.1 sulfur carrier protein ThiS [Aliifodinibius sp. S!AR15-10]
MKLHVNGDKIDTEAKTVKELLRQFEVEEEGKGTAVALNDSVVPKTKWDKQELEEDDRVEIIRATQGG